MLFNKFPLPFEHKKTNLLDSEESHLASHVRKCCYAGFPRSVKDICAAAKSITSLRPDSENPFLEKLPTRQWIKGFLARNNFKLRKSEKITNASATVTERGLRNWHKYCSDYFGKKEKLMEALQDPARNVNLDETGVAKDKADAQVAVDEEKPYGYRKSVGDPKNQVSI
jgi:hypothetical protein